MGTENFLCISFCRICCVYILRLKLLFWKCLTYVLGCSFIITCSLTGCFKLFCSSQWNRNKTFEETSKSRGVFRTREHLRWKCLWVFLIAYYFGYKPNHRRSTGLYIGLRKYWNFQRKAKVEKIIAIVTTRGVSCLVMEKRILILYENNHDIIPYKKNCFFLNI